MNAFAKVHVRNMYNGFEFPTGETFINVRPAGDRLVMRYFATTGHIKEMFVSKDFTVLVKK